MSNYRLQFILISAYIVLQTSDLVFAHLENVPTFTVLLSRYFLMGLGCLALIWYNRDGFKALKFIECWIFAFFGVATFSVGWFLIDFTGSIAYNVVGLAMIPLFSFAAKFIFSKDPARQNGLMSIAFLALGVTLAILILSEGTFDPVFSIAAIMFSVFFCFEMYTIRLLDDRRDLEGLKDVTAQGLVAACLMGLIVLLPFQLIVEFGLHIKFGFPQLGNELYPFPTIKSTIFLAIVFFAISALYFNIVNMKVTAKLKETIHPEIISQISLLFILGERIWVKKDNLNWELAFLALSLFIIASSSIFYTIATKTNKPTNQVSNQ